MRSYAETRDQPRLLVLSGNESWASAVQSAADQLGVARVQSVGSARDAVRYLSANGQLFSHLLLQPSSAGDLLAELVGLTAGEAQSGVALVVLGEVAGEKLHATKQMRVTFVEDASHGWLERALSAGPRHAADSAAVPEAELREALSSARIQTRYQPIVRIADRKPIGIEVLARLDHPARGTLPPHLFVPQSEATGLAAALTEAVMRRALEDWGGGKLEALGLTMSMNFPLDVLLLPDVLEALDALRCAAGIAASQLVIELTESRPLSHLPQLLRSITMLRQRGYGMAIDDVGPDVRDHRALLEMPFTTLKLDKELVREAPDNPDINDFLLETIAAARAANLTITAEGVEDADIWNRMAKLPVDHAQGFLVARPLPAAAVPIWHKDWCARQ